MARLLLVGPIEDNDPVPRRVLEQLNRDNRVHQAGMDWDTPPLYSAMDIVILPTYREGFPNVPLEAAAMELPVVATAIPGCIDAVEDGHTGRLVKPRDSEQLERGIRYYLDAPGLRDLHGRSGRKRALRDFRQDSIWEAIYDEYQRLLGASAVKWARVGEKAQ